MIHFSCDRCRRSIDTNLELRYEVKIEIQVALDASEEMQFDDERDHLDDVDELLLRVEEEDCELLCQQLYQTKRYDLCADCHAQYVANPIGSESQIRVGFSQN